MFYDYQAWLRASLAAVLLVSTSVVGEPAQVPQKVIFSDARASDDPRVTYKLEVLTQALEVTQAQYGPYELVINNGRMTNKRVIQRLEKGGAENVYFGVTSHELEQRLLPIRIPTRMGVLNYRLLLIHKDNAHRFADIRTVEQLKALTVGLGSQWGTRQVLESQGFSVTPSNTYDGLFKMLETKRYDYAPRGPNEIYLELEHFREQMPNVIVEPTLALFIAAPFYLFVSPHNPELAERLQVGLEHMVKSGWLRQHFYQHYQANIERAAIDKRYVIYIDNPLLPEQTPLERSELWYWPHPPRGN
ncbi:hypothetical protein IC617_11580 [Neiella sp. HB171785]|uniref:Amino acid ABC transporter substrate-binding protein n=1 Tax=Neiella litorisoli TaxID=2771431 RepID=A0A8J6QKP9_9GAMM|nr:hypothetical protein [Neiella litorisoli]MBD1390071.1 hypothetical protein [Neiella litorisoli]